MIGDVTLVVTPDVLRTQGDNVYKKIQSMQREFDNVANIISRTSGYWVGDAGNAYRSRYEQHKPELDEIFRRLNEFVVDLEKMAGVYEQTEAAATQVAQDLPSDVII